VCITYAADLHCKKPQTVTVGENDLSRVEKDVTYTNKKIPTVHGQR